MSLDKSSLVMNFILIITAAITVVNFVVAQSNHSSIIALTALSHFAHFNYFLIKLILKVITFKKKTLLFPLPGTNRTVL